MSEPRTDYDTGTADTGDETTPPRVLTTTTAPDGTVQETWSNGGTHTAGGPWVQQFDAAYWRAQAETAIRALDEALSRLSRMEAERDAARALADHALAIWAHWPVKVGGTVTSRLWAELRALDATVIRLRVEHPDG